MPIKVGDKIPAATLKTKTADGLSDVTTDDLFGGKKVLLFAVPGAFTPTCSAKHVPGYLSNAEAIKAKGIDTIACVAVNDAFVMDAWAKDQGVGDKLTMLADGTAAFTQAVDLGIDLSGPGLGLRSQRYAMLVEDGVVKTLAVEDNPGILDVSSAEQMLTKL